MAEERIGPETLRLLTRYYGSLLRRVELLAEAQQPPLSREEAARATDLGLAADAAHIVMQNGRVTREAIFDELERREPGLSYEALLKRWRRHTPPIRLSDILEVAGRR